MECDVGYILGIVDVEKIVVAIILLVCYGLGMSQRYTDTERAKLTERVLEVMPTESMAAACNKSGVPYGTFRGWIDSDSALAALSARAKEDYREYLAEKIMTLASDPYDTDDKGKIDSAAVQARRVEIETYRWMLSKQYPKHYGDRVTLSGDPDAPLNTIVKVTHEIVSQSAIEDKGNDDE